MVFHDEYYFSKVKADLAERKSFVYLYLCIWPKLLSRTKAMQNSITVHQNLKSNTLQFLLKKGRYIMILYGKSKLIDLKPKLSETCAE